MIDADGDLHCTGSSALLPPTGEYIDIDCGYAGCCALRLDGCVECWGDQWDGDGPSNPAACPDTR